MSTADAFWQGPKSSRSDALVFFGATGDLAYKKIFPALQAMVERGHARLSGHRRRQGGLDARAAARRGRARAWRSTAAGVDEPAFAKLLSTAALHRRRLRRPGDLRGSCKRARRRAGGPRTTWPSRRAVRDGGRGAGHVGLRTRRARRGGEAVRPRPRRRREELNRDRCTRSSPSSRSSASTTTSARRRCRTCCSSASPTPSSSRSGTATTSRACRSRWPRASASRAAAGSTTRPARSATWCRTTCCRWSASSRWSRRPTTYCGVDARRAGQGVPGHPPLRPEDVVRGQFEGYREGAGRGAGLARSRPSRRCGCNRLVALGRRAVLHPRGQVAARHGDRGDW